MSNSQLSVKVWRGGEQGRYDEFLVPRQENQTVLDVVSYIQRYMDETLSYRFACRVGVCGSCAMMVNGEPRWTCRTHVGKVSDNNQLTLAPLRNLPVIKDLVADMRSFFDKWQQAKGVFEGNYDRDTPVEALSPLSKNRQKIDAAIECINCGICYSACDTVRWNDDYFGPAALNRGFTLMLDERDSSKTERMGAISSENGCHNCHGQQNCSHYCPNGLDPAGNIARLKNMSLLSLLKTRDKS